MTWLIIKLAMVNLFHCPLRQSISHRHFFGYQTMSSIVRRLRILHLIFSSILVEVDRKLERTVFSRWRMQRQWKWKNTSAWHVSSTARQVGFLKLISAKLCEIDEDLWRHNVIQGEVWWSLTCNRVVFLVFIFKVYNIKRKRKEDKTDFCHYCPKRWSIL